MKQTQKKDTAKPPKEEVEPKPVEKKEPKPEKKVDAVFLKDAPKFGKKGDVRKMTEKAIAYINSQIKGVIKKL